MQFDWFSVPDLVLLIFGFFFEHLVEEVTFYQYMLKNVFGTLLDLLLNVLVYIYTGDTGALIGICISSFVIAVSFCMLCGASKKTKFSATENWSHAMTVIFMSYMSVLAISLSLWVLIKQQENVVSSALVLIILLGINGLWTFLVGSYVVCLCLLAVWSVTVTMVILGILIVCANMSLVVMEALVAFPTDCWLHLDNLYLANSTSNSQCNGGGDTSCEWCYNTQVGNGCVKGDHIDNTLDGKFNQPTKCTDLNLGAADKSFVASFALAFMHLFLMCFASCVWMKKKGNKGDALLSFLILGILFLIAIGIPLTNLVGTTAMTKDVPRALRELGFDYIDSFTGSADITAYDWSGYPYNVTSKWTTGKTYDIAVASTILGSGMVACMLIISCLLCIVARKKRNGG